MPTVNRYNYGHQFGPHVQSLIDDLANMLLSGEYVLSREVDNFEVAFSEFLGVSHTLGVNSGTDALMLGLQCLGIGPGSEVVTQANTFHATVCAICNAGASPVLVDADDSSYQMNASLVTDLLTERTSAILPVHLYGRLSSMSELSEIARQNNLHLIEDAAQAIGASVDGRYAGSFGSVGCFSFHPSKNLAAAGDGGAIVCDDDEIADKIRWYRNLGQKSQGDHIVVGVNSKLDAIQARILTWKLPNVMKWTEARNVVARQYQERLSDLPIIFQGFPAGEVHAYHLFTIRTPQRDALLAHLLVDGIDAVVRYPVPIHMQPAFSSFGWREGQFPVAEALAQELLCLPIRPDLSETEIDIVCDSIRNFFAR